MSNFQSVVNANPAPAVAGDFASQNPRASVLAAAGQLVAPAGGLKVGRFCFVNPADGTVHTAWVSGYQIGFLARNSQGLITVFLAGDSQVVPQGFMVTLFDEGEFFVQCSNPSTAADIIYADKTNGNPVSGSATTSVTGSIAALVLTVTAVGSGGLSVDDLIAGANVTVGTHIVNQLTGTPGGIGTYTVDISQTAASAAITTVGNVATGFISRGSATGGPAAAGELAIASSWGV